MSDPTFGERRVRVTFNPSGNTQIDAVKLAYAAIIDDLAEHQSVTNDPEAKRLYALALTSTEEAAMWAVKALTA